MLASGIAWYISEHMAHSSAGQHMAPQNLDLVWIHKRKKEKKEKEENTPPPLSPSLPPTLPPSSLSCSPLLLSIHLSLPVDAGKVKTEGEKKK